MKPNNIQRGVVSPDFNTPSSANLLRKAARATKENQKRWINRPFTLIDWNPVSRNDVQAVAVSNFDGDDPAVAPEKEVELKNLDKR